MTAPAWTATAGEKRFNWLIAPVALALLLVACPLASAAGDVHIRLAQAEPEADDPLPTAPPATQPAPTPEPPPSGSQETREPVTPPGMTKGLLKQIVPGIKAILPETTLQALGLPSETKVDPITGEALPPGTLDGRVRVSREELRALPFSAIGQIEARFGGNGAGQIGTGFLIAPGVVLTAAHVLYSPTAGPAVSASFSAACHTDKASGKLDPRYTQSVDRSGMRVSSDWREDQTSIAFDYGVLFLPDPGMLNDCGELPITAEDDDFFEKQASQRTPGFFVAGYPFDKATQTLWLARSRLRNAGPDAIRHLIDTMPGQSGGPLFIIGKSSATGSNVPLVIGIHSRPASGENYNVARRISAKVKDEIAGWIAGRRSATQQ